MGTPFGSFGFKVVAELDKQGLENGKGCFQEVSGLSAQIKVTDISEGGVNDMTRKILGHATYSNVVLKRGLCDMTMFNWIKEFISGGRGARMKVTIVLLDDSGNEKVSYILINAVPVKWDGPALSVMQDGIATESLELAYEKLEVIFK